MSVALTHICRCGSWGCRGLGLLVICLGVSLCVVQTHICGCGLWVCGVTVILSDSNYVRDAMTHIRGFKLHCSNLT